MEIIQPGSSHKALSGLQYASTLTNVAKGLEPEQSLLVLCLQVFVIFGVVIAPLLILVLLGVMMFAPLALRARRSCSNLLIGLFGFNFVEWLAVLIFGTNFYIRSLSSLATYQICAQIDGLIEDYFVGLGVPADQATCAAAEGHVVFAWFVLAFGCVLLYIATYAIVSLTNAALADQDGRSTYDNRGDNAAAIAKRADRWVSLNILVAPTGRQAMVSQSPRMMQKFASNQQFDYSDTSSPRLTTQMMRTMTPEQMAQQI
jgi:hypothetical protein